MSRIVGAILVAVFAFSATAVTAGPWGRSNCQSATSDALREAAIDSADVGDIYYVRRNGGGEDRAYRGYTAWVRLKSCKSGYVVIDLDELCSVSQTYTHGGCRVPGIQ